MTTELNKEVLEAAYADLLVRLTTDASYLDQFKGLRKVIADDIREAISALTAQPAEAGVTVKALEWDERNHADVYGVKDCYGQGPKRYFLYRASTIIGWYDDIEPAKAAAQTDHEARVRSAIVHPTPAPQGMETAVEPHPLARFGSDQVAGLGLYRVHWKSGGSSLAAIGMMENGDRWIAPTNWVKPSLVPSAGEWGEIERLEPIDPNAYPHMTGAAQEAVAWISKSRWDRMTSAEPWLTNIVYSEDQAPSFTCVPLYTTPQPAPSGVNAEMLAAARDLIGSRSETYKARNGRTMGIQDENGEKVWLVPSDEMFALEIAIAAAEAQPAAVGWQTMDSAPKDGTSVLLSCDCGFGGGSVVMTGSYGVNGLNRWTDAGNGTLSPCAWMPKPLPAAPKPKGDQHGA